MDVAYRPDFARSASTLNNIAEASSLRAWIEQQAIDVSWIAPTQRDALLRQAHFSTRIEGNPLTLPEVAALAEGRDIPVDARAKREVLNYFAALRWVWKAGLKKAIQEKDVLELHGILTAGALPRQEVGAYKTKPNVVYGEGRVIYRPPPPEAAQILTRAFLDWLNSREGQSEHAVVAAAIAHHRLVSIHPFMDGNGRTARALESWILYQRGFDTRHIFALDEFFDADRPRYYREIQAAREQGDRLTSWIEYVSEAVLETLRKTQVRIQALGAGKLRQKIVLSPRQERLLQILAQTPRMGGGELARALGVGRSALSKLMRPVLEARLVVKIGSTKAAFYRLRRGRHSS